MDARSAPGLASRSKALLELTRPGNVAMASVGALVGALVAGAMAWDTDVLLAMVVTGAVTAGGNALNDLRDHQVDQTAHPGRPLPSGRLPPGAAAALAGAGFLIGQAAAIPVGLDLLLLVVVVQALLMAYEIWLKGLPLVGNVVVALLVAATFEAGALAAGALPPAVHFLAGLALLANVGREVWKDAEDAEHDAGRTTFAQLAGLDRAHAVARVATLAAVLLSPLPFLYGFGGWPFLAVVALADALFITAALRTKPSQAQRFSKLGMLTALAAFTLGAIA